MSFLCPFPTAISRQLSRQSLFKTVHATRESMRDSHLHLSCGQSVLSAIRPNKLPRTSAGACTSFENRFVQCLLQAGQCRKHAIRSSNQHHTVLCIQPYRRIHSSRRHQHDKLPSHHPDTFKTYEQTTRRNVTRNELKGLLDYYLLPCDTGSSTQPLPLPLPSRASAATSDSFCSIDPQLESLYESREDTLSTLNDLLRDSNSTNEAILSTYEQLPPLRILNLSDETRHKLLHRLSVVERKPSEMLRFLTLVSEVKDAGLPLTKSEWNTTTFFTGRYLNHISDVGVEKAFLVWREMESQAGLRSSASTMTILFNMAIKAHKFVLAEMILEEVERRGLPKSLRFRTSIIFYQGMRKDGQGIRKYYQELVDAGEIVSTAVISCVISALLICGEPTAAEHVFERAKRLHAESSGRPLPPFHWKDRRKLGKSLEKLAFLVKGDELARKRQQAHVAIAPGIEAYQALIRYHTVVVGDLDRTSELISEMLSYEIPVSGSIFMSIFRAFWIHGGIIYTSWTKRRLEEVWTAFLKAQNQSTESHYLSKTSATHILKAYAKCSGLARTREVWAQILDHWKPVDDEQVEIEQILERFSEELDLTLISEEESSIDDDLISEHELYEENGVLLEEPPLERASG